MGGRLVGRDSALAIATSALSGAVGGSGRLLLVSGEAGIGKTALVRCVAEDAAQAGVRVVWAACPPGGGAPAYWPWAQIVRDVADASALPEAAAPLLTAGDVPPAADDTTARFELYDAVTRALTTPAQDTPILAVIDDLQWADRPSLDLLDLVARRLGGHRVLLVGTYRDVEAPAALDRIAASTDGITLGGIDTEAVIDLVTTITAAPPSAAEAELLRDRTGGNPLFVRELARLIVASGTRPTATRGLPATVAETLAGRLERLSVQCRALLRVVAVADSVDPALLTRVTGDQWDTIKAGLVEAEMARVLVDGGAADRPFAHDLFREAVLADLSVEEQRATHGAVASALIDLATATSAAAPPGSVATHLIASLPPPPHEDPVGARLAAEWSVRAAEAAAARLGHEESVRLYRQAIDVAPAPDVRLLAALADAQVRAGDPEATQTYLEAAEQARRAGDTDALVSAALGVHRVGARGDHSAQLALLDAAIAAVPPGSLEQARLLAALARDRRHDYERATDARVPAEQAVAIARDQDAHLVLAECLLALHDALWVPGSADARLPVIEEMAAAASSAGSPELLAQATVLRAACLIELNDPRGLAELLDYCRQQEVLGNARGRWESTSRRATAALITGAPDEALALAEEALELGQRMGIPDAQGVHGTLTWALTEIHGARSSLLESVLGIEIDAYRAAFTAAAHRADGDPAVARAAAQTIRWPVAIPGATDLEFAALGADALVAAGPTDDARACYQDLLRHAGTNVLVGGCASYWGPVDLYLGQLAAALGDEAAAVRHLTDAATMAKDLGAPLWQQRATTLRDAVGTASETAPRFVRAGDVWTVSWKDRSAHVPDSKGIRDLAHLVARPGEEVAATVLMGTRPVAGADPVLDDVAKAAYRRRLADLEEEIEDAEADHDDLRAERARDERSALVDELAAAVGLGGRDRRLGDDAERARKAVTARIRDAVRRVTDVQPEIGAHLAEAVHTGNWCSYRPS